VISIRGEREMNADTFHHVEGISSLQSATVVNMFGGKERLEGLKPWWKTGTQKCLLGVSCHDMTPKHYIITINIIFINSPRGSKNTSRN
jgi:hypothetical protein